MRHTAALFATSLVVRAVHWLASPQQREPFEASYQGDAPYWQQLANGTAGLESLLPFRPPAMGWFARAMWDGGADAFVPRAVMVVLGALVAPLLYLALRRSFAPRIALLAAWICALSNALIVLGSGVHGEIPYLLLFVATLPDFERLRQSNAPLAAVRWSLLHALACLFRADHLLCVVVSLLWLAWTSRMTRARDLGIAIATFTLALLPWQLHVGQRIADFNSGAIGAPAPRLPLPSSLPWDEEALAAVRALPPFAQLATAGFVGDTVRVRGGTRVSTADLGILDEAYGYGPEPVHTPLLALYGPLNFFLANCTESGGGFTRAALDRTPPLHGGPGRYPPGLLQVLPRELELSYPPHLLAVNHGYRLGLTWWIDHPADGLALVVHKLTLSWRGAAAGFGLGNLPLARSGIREPVDLVVADGFFAAIWRAALLVLAGLGAFRLRREPAIAALAIWLATKLVIIAAFFGYARLGALCIPTLAVLWSAALLPRSRTEFPTLRPRVLILACLAIGLEVLIARPWANADVSGSTGPHDRAVVRY